MKQEDARRQLDYAAEVMPGVGNELAIGEWSMERVASDYELVREAYDLGPLDAPAAFTNDYIDPSVRYPGQG